MAQSKEFVDASHALNDLSHALALLESENTSLRGATDRLCNENAKLRELIADVHEALCADKAGMFYKLILASMEDDMRELGIEVEP